MKLKDIEVTSYDDCPLRDLCNTIHCGSPDICLFCSMSDEELEMRDISVNVHKGTTKGLVKVYNNTGCFMIPKNELPSWEDLGYKRGDPNRIHPTTLGKKRVSKPGLPSKYVSPDQLEILLAQGWLLHKDFLKSF